MNIATRKMSRRRVLRAGLQGCVAISGGPLVAACHSDSDAPAQVASNIANLGALQPADENGLRLPEGFSSRVLARTDAFPEYASGATGAELWHDLPDGGATFATDSGGWIYVSNSEGNNGLGGVGALEFNANGDLIDNFRLLSGTTKNCAGGPTPWGTWLSCEEYPGGAVWETFPLERGARSAERRDALGIFQHEAAAIDPATGIVYLTEDQVDGCFYRFVPDVAGSLEGGTLQAAVVDPVDAGNIAREGMLSWVTVPDRAGPDGGSGVSTRQQAQDRGAAIFVRGEGCWWHAGVCYLSTTVDGAGGGIVWAFTPDATGNGVLTQIYNRTDLYPADSSLNGVDNITVSAGGDVLVAEDSDGTQLQIQALTPAGEQVPLLELEGHTVGGFFPGEITGPAFDPSGTRLYFSSQRGTDEDFQSQGKVIGVTFEVAGPFVI